MQQQAKLSSALLVADVNDFLTPSQACVLPLEGGAIAEPEGSVLAPIVSKPSTSRDDSNGNGADKGKKATITLSDCLACSGCVTSAETVLLSTAHLERLRVARISALPESRAEHYAIAALSQQAVAALAVRYQLPLATCARKLAAFLRTHCHFDAVVDLSRARALAHAEGAVEFLTRHRAGLLPLVCSACPGWLTYAEKTLSESMLEHVSEVRSPQAVFARWARTTHERPLWLATVMPCHDKKIEAARPEYEDEVQCVLTTEEVRYLLEQQEYDLATGPHHDLLDTYSLVPGDFGASIGSGSGGYADYILHVAARDILGLQLEHPVKWVKASRSGDMRSVVLEHQGQKLRFACAYGFRSLQSLLRKMRRGTCEYDYIELMACPGGCNNGGGQIPPQPPPDAVADGRALKSVGAELLQQVESAYFQAPHVSIDDCEQSVQLIVDDEGREELLRTKIVQRKTSTAGALAW